MALNIELTRFKVKQGKTAVVDRWMKFLNDHMDKVLLTLNNEKMFVETIFREELEGAEYLYWYSIQGDGGSEVEDSDHEVDKKHMEFWRECIDSGYAPVDLKTEAVMIPKYVDDVMK